MGRRSVRKPDPALDLSAHLVSLDEWIPEGLGRSCSVDDLFPDAMPLEIEIGTGKGLFLVSAARQVPDHNFLGVELAARYARHAASRLARAGLGNARVVHGDGQRLLEDAVPNDSVTAVHLYFPDPWWKKRHKKRRVIGERFLREIERILIPGGRFHFWTDVEEYFEVSLELLREVTHLAGPNSVDERPAEHDLDYRTHFERRTRLQGRPVYRCWFGKVG